jgi:hypothetical protein
MSSRKPMPKPVKPRFPLPMKPPKAEPKSNAYTRQDKHKKNWETERGPDAPSAEKDK